MNETSRSFTITNVIDQVCTAGSEKEKGPEKAVKVNKRRKRSNEDKSAPESLQRSDSVSTTADASTPSPALQRSP